MKKINHIKHSNIDFEKWDKTVLSSEFPLVFAQSFYLNATSPNWDALILNDYESIFPLTIKSKFGFNYLPQPPFTSQLGVYGKVNNEIEKLFYNYIKLNFKLIEIELNASNKLITENTFIKKTFVINYKNKFNYNQNTKRNIKKAIDNKFKVEFVAEEEFLPLSKQLINPFLINEIRLPKSTINIFDDLINRSIKNKKLIVFKTIDSNGNIKAIAYFIYNEKHALYLKGVSINKTENNGSMHLLLDYAINYFKERVLCFDFGGGSLNLNLAQFYSGFGSTELNYNFLKINDLPIFINWMKKIRI